MPLSSPGPWFPSQMAWALVLALLTGCVTLGGCLPISGSGMSSGIQAQCRQLRLDRDWQGMGPSVLPLPQQVSGWGQHKRAHGPVPATVVQ